jgi:nitrilase
VTTTLKGVKLTIACAICWENYMPLLRQSMYYQNVNLYLAPTADQTPTWMPLMQTIGFESRAFVLSANQCQKRKHLPSWIHEEQPQFKKTATAHHIKPSQPPVLKPSLRRKSTITKTEDNHEITWPLIEADTIVPEAFSPSTTSTSHDRNTSSHQPPQFSKSNSVFSSDSEDGGPVHEICLPDKTTVRTTAEEEVPKRNVDSEAEEFVSRGGSSIVSPFGKVLAGPLWEVTDGSVLSVDVDFEDCDRGRLDLDVSGHYSRRDQFHLSVEGLVLDPPV